MWPFKMKSNFLKSSDQNEEMLGFKIPRNFIIFTNELSSKWIQEYTTSQSWPPRSNKLCKVIGQHRLGQKEEAILLVFSFSSFSVCFDSYLFLYLDPIL